MIPAIVIGCNEIDVGTIRALGRKGIPVVGVYFDNSEMGRFSKYVVERVRAPDIKKSEKAFIKFLIKKSNQWKGGLLIPLTGSSLIAVSKHKKELEKYYVVSVPDWETLRKAIYKKETYALAKKARVAFPKTFYPTSMKFLEKHKKEFVFPCILKPIENYPFYERFKTKLFMVNNFHDLKSKFQKTLRAGFDMMIQEIIPGADDQIYKSGVYVDSKHNYLVELTSRNLRQSPPGFGVGRVVVSKDYPEIKRLSRRLLNKLRYRGAASFEFKLDPKDKKFKLLDFNARCFVGHGLRTAKATVPYIMYMDLIKNKKIKITKFEENIYWINLVADIYRTLFNHKDENWGIRDYLRPYFKKKVFAVLDFQDIKPFIFQWLKYLCKLPKYIRRR